jgi:glycosyltransferase involved in cell wall biosynthesis
MRVAVDAAPLLVRSAGVKNYLYHWIDALRRTAAGDDLQTVPNLPRAPLDHEHSALNGWKTVASLARLAAQNYIPLDAVVGQLRGADLFHASSLIRRPPKGMRLTATIHDVTSWLMPQLHPPANQRADRHLADLLRRADGAIAVSESTRQDAIRVLHLDPEKIEVIHSGVPDAFFTLTPEAIEEVRIRYKLTRPFVLSVGTIEPRKNIDGLLDAFESLPAALREEFGLVLAGPMGWASDATKARLGKAGHGQVRYLGYVPERDIAPLTGAAAVLACPSFYEGFGFPVAQAMAAGVPVLTSNLSALPEVAGDAALLANPQSVSEIRNGLAKLLESKELRDRLGARGRTRARQFRWDVCARRSWEFFHKIAGSP